MPDKNKRKRLYAIKTGFRIVRDDHKNYGFKFDEFLCYLWTTCPSGILRRFFAWIVIALNEYGFEIDREDFDSALSNAFRKYEKAKGRSGK